ncbi:MAG: DUF1501 domain-containing protein [Verrucomicrobiota bacterium]
MNPFPNRCDGVSRRDFLHLGVLTSFGLSLPSLLRMQAAAAETGKGAARAKSCILIWLDGGPSHLDMFDLKPDAPSEVRSQFKAIGTAVPGVQICEHLSRTAKVMKDVALIRSLTHELGNHDTGTRFLLTGHRPTPALEYPSIGSLVSHATGSGGTIPPYVAIPHDGVGGDSTGARSGYLPGAFAAFSTGRDPSRVDGLQLPEGVGFERNNRRHAMLEKMDALSRQMDQGAGKENRDAFYEQAWRLLSSPEAKAAFDLSRETAQTRERYGHANIGAGCLLARRLVEAGSRFVTVVDPGWDMHQQIFRELPDSRFPGSGKLPSLDRAYAALLTDLRERGLLDSTLVVLMGEFGRTPKLNAIGGRDHWPRAGSVLMAGGGVRGGQVIGATNEFGEFPVDRPVGPPDLAFSMLKLLGVDPTAELMSPGGRPLKIMSEGSFIKELL